MLHATVLEVYIQSPHHGKPGIYIGRHIIYLKGVRLLFRGQMMTVPDVKINIKTGSILVLSVGRMPCAIINFFQAILAPWRFTSCRQWSVLRLIIYMFYYVYWYKCTPTDPSFTTFCFTWILIHCLFPSRLWLIYSSSDVTQTIHFIQI